MKQAGVVRRLFPALASLAAVLSLAACGGGGDGTTAEEGDPGTPPPAAITDPTVTLASSLSAPDANGVVTINLSGLPAGSELPASAFTVVESQGAGLAGRDTAMRAGRADAGTQGVVKRLLSVEKIGSGSTRAGADVAFVFDTTGSMGSALDSVKDSIVGFVDQLDAKGLDVRVGAVTFGDAFDTRAGGSASSGVSLGDQAPPSFDTSERPTFALTANYTDFKTFIGQQAPRGGGDGPENALGALEFAYETLAWRTGAQRILIAITDICSHNAATADEAGITAAWMPTSVEAVLAKLKGQAIVHVIAPRQALEYCGPTSSGDDTSYTGMDAFTGVSGTGGVFFDWSGFERFDLTELPITDAVAGGYLIKYVTGIDGKRRVRVVVDDGADIRGETTVTSE